MKTTQTLNKKIYSESDHVRQVKVERATENCC